MRAFGTKQSYNFHAAAKNIPTLLRGKTQVVVRKMHNYPRLDKKILDGQLSC